ncbi:hypothetical protein KGQ20_26750 [Catenulispora sp. NF23]|uniref:Antitoxin n=1 Tax=Catenulispora pinistramenti TaxID=2705254 RepID=A0ABS5KUF7_9ACTN|nr:hypothetical protein [Catenulispora pinistramenti]MBS2536366.1 hypothetical protein [Catenulispora pinistramenti]MBS2549678.1 hypothetical protein [Catenulispora pinistramenti]
MAMKTIGFAVSEKDLAALDELAEYFADGNRSAYLRQTIKIMKSVKHAEELRKIQAYGAQRSAESGITVDDITTICRRVLKGRE